MEVTLAIAIVTGAIVVVRFQLQPDMLVLEKVATFGLWIWYPTLIHNMNIRLVITPVTAPWKIMQAKLVILCTHVYTHIYIYTVNQRGYTGNSLWENFAKNGRDLSRLGNTPFSLIKSYGFYFRAVEIFEKNVI